MKYIVKLHDESTKTLTEDEIFDLIYSGGLTEDTQLSTYDAPYKWLNIQDIPVFRSAILAYKKTLDVQDDKEEKTAITKTIATVIDEQALEPEHTENEVQLKADPIKPYEEQSSLVSSMAIAKPRKKNRVLLTSLYSAIGIILVVFFMSYFGVEKTKELYTSKLKLIQEYLSSVADHPVEIELPIVRSEEYNSVKSSRLLKEAVKLLSNDDVYSYKQAVEKLQEANVYDTTNRSIISLLAYAYAKLYYSSKMDPSYINTLNALITRAGHGDMDLQTISLAQIAYQNLIGNYDYAISIFSEAINLLKKVKLQPLLLIAGARAYIGKKDFKSASLILDKLAETQEPYPEIYYLKGLILEESNKLDALENYNLAVEINKNHIPSILRIFKDKTQYKIDDFFELAKKYQYMTIKEASELLALYGDFLLKENDKKTYAIKAYQMAIAVYGQNKYAVSKLNELGLSPKIINKKQDTVLLKKKSDASVFILRGDELFSVGKYRDAVLQYRMAASLDETDINAWYKLGEAYRLSYDYENAIRAYLTGLNYNKVSVKLLSKLSLVYVYLYNFNEAYKNLQKAELLDPENPDVLYTFGVLFEKRGNDEKAIQYYHKALANDFSHFSSLLALAKIYFRFKSYDDASLLFKKVLSVKPDYFEAYIYIARIKAKTESIDKVKRYIDSVRKTFPDIPETDLAVAQAYIEKKNYDQAELIMKKLRKKYPESLTVIRYYANFLLKQSRITEYLAYLNLITILAPYDLDIRYQEAITYCNIKKVNICEQRLLDIVKLTVYYPRVSYKLGEIYYNSGKLADAEEALKTEVKYNPGIKASYLLLGEIYLETNRPEKAVELYRNMLAHNPNDAYGFLGLARSCYYSGDFNCAKDFISQAKAVNPDIVEIYLLECELYYKLSLFNESRVACKTFLRRAPKHYGAPRASKILLKVT